MMEITQMPTKSTFCPIPWMFQAVRNNGDVRICCQANVTKNQGVVRHMDGTSYNAGKHDMKEARTADFMNVVRKNMLKVFERLKRVMICIRCIQENHS